MDDLSSNDAPPSYTDVVNENSGRYAQPNQTGNYPQNVPMVPINQPQAKQTIVLNVTCDCPSCMV